MRVRIPQNQIVESKYTVGNEYMFESTYKEYQGYYYELNGNIFAGKDFNTNAPTLIKINSSNTNKMLLDPNTMIYGRLSGINITNPSVPSFTYQPQQNPNASYVIRYFAQKINVTPSLIKEISVDTYSQIKSDPFYKTTSLNWVENADNSPAIQVAERTIPGLNDFLQDNIISDSPDLG
jgi:hypothetical protein